MFCFFNHHARLILSYFCTVSEGFFLQIWVFSFENAIDAKLYAFVFKLNFSVVSWVRD